MRIGSTKCSCRCPACSIIRPSLPEATQAASEEAQVAFVEMAQDHLPDGTHAEFFSKVEDEAGTEIYRASLNFRGENAEQIKQADRDAEAAAAEIASLVGRVR